MLKPKNQEPFLFNVRMISPETTYGLRFKILRPHQPIEACYYPGDTQPQNFHIGAYHDEYLVSIGSFFLERHSKIEGTIQYRLRGMATIEAYRGRGAGSAIIKYGKQILKEKQVDTWWCNARVSAAAYYIKHGMNQIGDIYEIKPIGMHKLMYKKV